MVPLSSAYHQRCDAEEGKTATIFLTREIAFLPKMLLLATNTKKCCFWVMAELKKCNYDAL